MNFKKGDQLRYHQDLKTTTFLVRNQIWNNHATHYLYVWISGFKVWWFFLSLLGFFGGGCFVLFCFLIVKKELPEKLLNLRQLCPSFCPSACCCTFLLHPVFKQTQKVGKAGSCAQQNNFIDHPHTGYQWNVLLKKVAFCTGLGSKSSDMKELNVASWI